jgi:hypothetical protein
VGVRAFARRELQPVAGHVRAVRQERAEHIKGAWDVTIGNWSDVFLFSGTADVSWEDQTKAKGVRHKGYWWTDDDAILWQFADDPPASRRTFRIDQSKRP